MKEILGDHVDAMARGAAADYLRIAKKNVTNRKAIVVVGEGRATIAQLAVYAKFLARFLADFCDEIKKPRQPEPPLPIDNELVEAMAFAFLRGDFQSMRGGFPSVAFHDGYREYDERMESWLSGRISAHERCKYETEYAAGAFALHLKREGVEV